MPAIMLKPGFESNDESLFLLNSEYPYLWVYFVYIFLLLLLLQLISTTTTSSASPTTNDKANGEAVSCSKTSSV